MGVINGNKDNFDSLISNGLVIVDFYANWCGPCKMLSPILEEFASNNDLVSVVKINVDDEEDLARKYGIMSIPTLLMFKNGDLISTKNGFMPLPVLETWINDSK